MVMFLVNLAALFFFPPALFITIPLWVISSKVGKKS